ncbi:MAG: NAD(P)-dependent oxidoreductase, partial [Acidobacteria bacterium]
PLSLYSRSREKAMAFSAAGAKVASSPREAASGADIVISMVADDVASRDVWLGENGVLAGTSNGSVLIECSTLTAGWVKELAVAAESKGCEFLDAPVTGSKPQAASGELIFLVGGSAATLERVRPVLSVMGRDAIHLGPHGSGAMMKLINNFLCGVQAASVAEATSMISAAGLDRGKAMSILASGAPGSPIVKRIASRLEANDFDPNFTLKLMAKDLSYAVKEASARDLRLQTAASALAIFEQAIAAGHGEEDFSAVTKIVTHA